jgi:biopolymer transport protein ExbB
MWVLIVLSIISVTIMIERALFFWGRRPDISVIIDKVLNFLKKGDFEGARKYLKPLKGVAPSIALSALNEASHGIKAVDEAAQGARIKERLQLEKNLAFLGTVGSNAPFIGLLGTVIGIIQAFNELSLNTSGGASTVMSGISEALVATAIGLLVAIPAVVAFNVFQRRIKILLGDADSLMHIVLSGLNAAEKTKK